MPKNEFSLPETRQICAFQSYGGPEKLEWQTERLRQPKTGEVLVRVEAVSVNPVDWKILDGRMRPITPSGKKPFKPRIFGSDFSATVVACGAGVEEFSPGDQVIGMRNPLASGSWADYLYVKPSWMAKAVPNIDLATQAAIPQSGITALMVAKQRKPQKWADTRVLLNGAAGGVGTYLLQILVSYGAKVHAVASSPRHETLITLGAESCSDYREISVENLGRRFDVIIDTHGSMLKTKPGLLFAKNARRKLLVLVSIPNQAIPGAVIRAIGRWFQRIRTMIFLAVPSKKLLTELTDFCGTRVFRPLIQSLYDRADFREAVAESIRGHSLGKILVKVRQ